MCAGPGGQPGNAQRRNPPTGSQLKRDAREDVVFAFLSDHGCWEGTLAQLRDEIMKKKGLEISISTLSRYLKGSKYQRPGNPPRAAKVPGKPGREFEAVSFDPPASMPDTDAHTMPDDD